MSSWIRSREIHGNQCRCRRTDHLPLVTVSRTLAQESGKAGGRTRGLTAAGTDPMMCATFDAASLCCRKPDYQELHVEQHGRRIRVGHSPDPDDAFMFYALARDKLDTGHYHFEHELADIETLNRRAFAGDLELTAVSLHAYAHLADQYVLCCCGASMGDGYGPMVVARQPMTPAELAQKRIAVPGTLTTAYLALRMHLDADFSYVEVPFDEIIPAVLAGSFAGQAVDAGLLIHEGQLTFADHGLQLVVDLGRWWSEQTGLPLPLGANALRRDLGEATCRDVHRLLRRSIEYGLDHRAEALKYAERFGRNLNHARADRFVAMYVNDWTLDFGPRGREAVAALLRQGHRQQIIPRLVTPEFVMDDSSRAALPEES